jgi:hypothetical protein
MKMYLAGNLSDGRRPNERDDPTAYEVVESTTFEGAILAIQQRRDVEIANPKEIWDAAVARGMDPTPAVHRLVSFAYQQYTPSYQRLKSQAGSSIEYAIDSGAFSAWSRQQTIDLEEYAEYILAHRDLYTGWVASLDVIPGRKGGPKPTSAERARAADEGWENWVQLTKMLKPAGIKPIHTYHIGEPIEFLNRLTDESEHLSLGGTSTLPTKQKIEWLDSVWPYLTDDKGWPIRKVHGFACTAVKIMQRYPWYSVDSASWLHSSEHGDCYIKLPGGGHATVNFQFDDWNETPSRHFSQWGEADRKVIAAYLAQCGFTPEEMCEVYCECCGYNLSYLNRDVVNVDFFWNIEEEKTRNPRPWRRPVGVFRLR